MSYEYLRYLLWRVSQGLLSDLLPWLRCFSAASVNHQNFLSHLSLQLMQRKIYLGYIHWDPNINSCMLPHVSCVAFYNGHISKSATDFGLDVWADADTKEMHNVEKCTPNAMGDTDNSTTHALVVWDWRLVRDKLQCFQSTHPRPSPCLTFGPQSHLHHLRFFVPDKSANPKRERLFLRR